MKKHTTSLLTVVTSIALSNISNAAVIHWNGASGDWNTAANWAGARLPGSEVGDDVISSGADNPHVNSAVTGTNNFDIIVRSGGDLTIAADMSNIVNFSVSTNGNTA